MEKRKIIRLIFLIVSGLVIGWREWQNYASATGNVKIIERDENLIASMNHFQEVNTPAEAASLIGLVLLGIILAFALNIFFQARPKLSSPNSV